MSALKAVKFLPHIKEVRIHLCQKSEASKGVRDFVERYYIDLKKANPKTPILIRECSGILPKIHARHEKGFEVSAAVTDMPADKVATVLGNLVQK